MYWLVPTFPVGVLHGKRDRVEPPGPNLAKSRVPLTDPIGRTFHHSWRNFTVKCVARCWWLAVEFCQQRAWWAALTVQRSVICSGIACAQVIRVAHSGWRSSCYVDSGFLAFLLLRWYFPIGFSGCRGLLQIVCCILFSHGVFLFPGSLAGYVAGFLFVVRIACRVGLGHIRFCSLPWPSSLMLWFWLWHYTVFCLIYPCFLVLLRFLFLSSIVSSGRPLFFVRLRFLVLLVFWILLPLWFGFLEPLWIGWSFVHRHWVLLRCLHCVSSMCWFRAVLCPLLGLLPSSCLFFLLAWISFSL